MLSTRKLLAVGALVAGMLLPAQAMAAVEAHPTVDLNVRIGPSVSYGVIAVAPAWHPVTVFGCLDDISWCDIDFAGLRGWVSARYLVQPGTAVYLPQWAPRVGLPIVSFSFHVYHDRHYRGRPWHRQRAGRWTGRQEVHTRRSRQTQQQTRQAPRRQQTEQQAPQRQTTRRAPRRQQTNSSAAAPDRRAPRRQQRAAAPRRPQAQATQIQRRQQATQGQRSSRALQQQQRGPRAERQGRGRGEDRRKRRRN
jgi:uncharacterized protein YraI